MVLRQELYQATHEEEEWTEMHGPFKKWCNNFAIVKAGPIIAGLGKMAWRKTEMWPFFSARNDLEATLNTWSEFGSPSWQSGMWIFIKRRDTSQWNWSESSSVSFDKVDDLWLCFCSPFSF